MKIAFLTAGGIAPCLSASIGRLIRNYSQTSQSVEMIAYLHGYKGLLTGNSIPITTQIIDNAEILYEYGGSPIGNSRVKLTNVEDCVKNGYIQEGEDPLKVAADQLVRDEVTVLHTIGGDDTNTTAGDLVCYLAENGYTLTVVGLPKTVDNDVYPIQQTLGAWTAAEQGALFFENIANENTTSSRQLIIHEVMGRNCGWLTAATSMEYRRRLEVKSYLPSIFIDRERWDIDAVYIPEQPIHIQAEIERLKLRMDEKDSVNIFLSEGAGIDDIVQDLETRGEPVKRDAFGHVRLDEINPGLYFAKQFAEGVHADKVLVQKSGYFARSAKPNKKDLGLIFQTADYANECALNGKSGVVGIDEDFDNQLRCIEFERIKGGKPFNPTVGWYQSILTDIGQSTMKEVLQ
ncbi:MAG: pyrophosphate--fructose-6-phosphate 1-phosphotransferase [Candidatus Marinimicrobia bacterium]|jgi:pyrophosphate--fructose-6-phosphate 1-phosphotransferase|nr:pyrophosphate--fructose-6-phosphate 1-phosphotransferase [Candidatus Neomarinimicrobiota bacterium]MDP6936201.1 pyrophosphate--fructose-6-phosphate 1-phosphotransferase [Candidatus Neomarinimicrobiota bacterium]